MSPGLDPSTRPRARSTHIAPDPASCTGSTLLMPDVEASGHDPFVSSDGQPFAPDPALRVIRDHATQVAPLTLNHTTLTIPEVEASIHRSTPYGADHTIARAEVEASSCSNPMAYAMRDDHDTHLTSLNFTCVGITPSGVVLTQHLQLDYFGYTDSRLLWTREFASLPDISRT